MFALSVYLFLKLYEKSRIYSEGFSNVELTNFLVNMANNIRLYV